MATDVGRLRDRRAAPARIARPLHNRLVAPGRGTLSVVPASNESRVHEGVATFGFVCVRARGRRRGGIAAALVGLSLVSSPAAALDKQGSAHAGSVAGAESGVALGGTLSLGLSLYNPTYAARPNNTGLTLLRYALHLDLDVIGRRLSFPLDLNMFTDRKRHGAAVLAPTEVDLIGGVTTTWDLGPGALEGGVRVERDGPVDAAGKGYSQTYVDVRARYLYSLAAVRPGVARALRGGDLSGWVTLGAFAFNPTYAARPDNSGLALLRYAGHWEISFLDGHLAVGLDFTMFTDRKAKNPVAPTELDATPEIIGRLKPFELHLALEHDAPLDRGGLRQTFLYALLGFSFEAFSVETKSKGR